MKKGYLFAVASIVAIALSSPALAQDGPEVPAAPAAEPDLQSDIIVTAQRRAERLQDVPISITSLGTETLRQANVTQLSDIVKLTPAVRFDYTSDFVQPTIRGVGNSVVSAGAGSNVGIYIDGFYSANPLAGDFQLLNLEGIQVLKGPQGTLFGRNTTGGAILVTSTKPSYDTHGVFEASYGRFNTANLRGYVTTGLSDNIAIDLGGSFKHTDGYVKNIIAGPEHPGRANDWSIRAGLNIEFSKSASVLLRYSHIDMNDATNEVWGVFKQDGITYAAFQGTPQQFPSSLVPTGYQEVAINAASQPNFRYKADIFQMTGNLDLGFANLTSYTQYRREGSSSISDGDQTGVDFNFQDVHVEDKTFTQEFLLTSKPGGPLQYTAGVFYFNYIDTFDPIRFGANGNFNPLYFQLGTHARVQSIAGYVDATYQLGDHLFLTAGARYTHDNFDQGSFRFDPFPATVFPGQSGNSFTPRAVVRYQFDNRSSLYASYTRGYKSGLVDVVSGGGKVDPEKMDAFEIGYKYSSSGLTFNIASWYYDYKGLQVSIYPTGLAQVVNAANARIYGVEGDLHYRVTPDFDVNIGGAYVDAKYRDFANGSRYVECVDPVACGTGYGQYLLVTTDASGNDLQRAPKFTANAGARYGFNVGGGRAVLSGNYFYTSKFYFDAAQQFRQDAYGLLGLRVEWTDASEHLTLAAYGDNITGSQYRNQAILHSPGIGSVWGAPATWNVSARIKF